MGRSALVIKTNELQTIVTQLESDKNFNSLGELCIAIEATAWAKGIRNEKHVIRGLSAQVAGREIKARNITCQTKPGTRGRASGSKVSKTSRADKLAKLDLGDYPTRLRAEVKDAPERYKSLVELAILGNPIAACKLQCGACMGYTGAEKACDGKFGGTPCPTYPINRLVYSARRDFVPGDNGFYLLQAVHAANSEIA